MRDAEECRKGGDVCVDMWNIRVGAGIGLVLLLLHGAI